MRLYHQRVRGIARALALYAPVWTAALLAHSASLKSGFVFDDNRLLLENAYVKEFGGLKTLLTHSLFSTTPFPFEGTFYRPVSSLSYWLTWQLFKDNAALHHAVNIVLHAMVASLLLRTIAAYGVRSAIACIVAVLFAVHPVTAEIVDYIGGRQDLMGWAITLACLSQLPRMKRTTSIAILSCAGTVLALFCREFFATAAVLFIIGSAVRPDDHSQTRSRLAASATGACAGIGIDMALRHAFDIPRIPFRELVTAHTPKVLWGTGSRLLKIVFWPSDVVSETSIHPQPAIFALLTLIPLAVLALLVWRLRRQSLYLMGMAGSATIVLSILLPLYIAQTEWVLGDRYGYETLVGVALLAGAWAEQLVSTGAIRLPSTMVRRLVWAAPFLIAVAVIPLTRGRAFCYTDDEVLAECDAETRPDDALVLLRRSHQLQGSGQIDRAFPYCAAYLTRAPERRLHVADCIGSYLLLHDQPTAAIPFLRDVAYARPRWIQSRSAYFLALTLAGDYDGATREIDAWKRRFPNAEDLNASAREVQLVKNGKKISLSYAGLRKLSR